MTDPKDRAKLVDEVTEEKWLVSDLGIYGAMVALEHRPGGSNEVVSTSEGPPAFIRAAIAVLGKRALNVLIEQEWCDVYRPVDPDARGFACCPECGGCDPEMNHPEVWASDRERVEQWGHRADCEWGAILAELKRLRDG